MEGQRNIVEQIVINSIEDYKKTQRRVEDLLEGEVSKSRVVALARSLAAGEGQKMNVDHLRACIYTEAGVRLKDTSLIEEGIQIWEGFRPHGSAATSYNLGSGHLHLWQFAVEQNGLGDAWLNKRDHLHEARRLFNRVAQDEHAETELRLQALADCGNSFDIVGRYLDALGCYGRALKLDSSFGMASGNRGITLLIVARFMQGHKSYVLQQAAADLDVAINDQKRVLRCGGRSALDIFKRQRSRLSVSGDSHHHAVEASPQFDDPHLNWCLHNELFLHFSPECIRTGSKTLDSVSFVSFELKFSDGPVLDRANELIDAFNSIKQDYIAARYLVWLAIGDSPIQEQAKTITRYTTFWDTYNYAHWGVRPGIGVQALKAVLDTLDTIAAFVHLYLRSDRAARSVDFGTLPYANQSKKSLAPSLAEVLKQPESNRGLAALIDSSAELDKQRNSRLRELIQRRHAATHRFFVVHLFGAHESSNWTEHVSWSELIQDSLEALQITRAAILHLAQMIQIHEEAKQELNPEGSLTMPLPFDPIDTDLMEFD